MYPKEVIYKKHMVAARFHTVCGEWLSGDGSLVYPHKCSCGTWMFDWSDQTYRIKPESEASPELKSMEDGK